MADVIFLPGKNIVHSNADCLVNTVNCVGVMGKGVALAFKTTFPQIMGPYQSACRTGKILPGTANLYPLRVKNGRLTHWAAFASKNHWRNPSEYEWIKTALANLALNAKAAGVHSIALPPVGCGNGGLNWDLVKPMVLESLSEFNLEIYAT